MNPPSTTLLSRLRSTLVEFDPGETAPAKLDALIALGLDQLAHPGSGNTLERWRALAAVAEHDLSLAKLYEGHTDALAILAELRVDRAAGLAGRSWGVWAAESPGGRTLIEQVRGNHAVLSGGKFWCSGATSASDALATAWHADGTGPQLVHIPLNQPGIRIDATGWRAVGMPGSASVDVKFERAEATLVGGSGDYLARAGFWQGGAGIAACWFGGTLAIAETLYRSLRDAPAASPSTLKQLALGEVDCALSCARAVLRESAAWIDAHPTDDASAAAIRVRLVCERTAQEVLQIVGRALGAGPYCRDARFARVAADLPVFIRQCHGDRDLAALGARVSAAEDAPWSL